MIAMIKFIIIIIIACLLGYFISYGQGHVIILLAKYRIDVSLVTVVISAIFIFILCYFLIRLWVNIGILLNKIHNWRAKHIPK